MEERNPLQQAEEILKEAELQAGYEAMQLHAQTLLLSAVTQRQLLEADLLHQASKRGSEYMCTLLIAIAVHARNTCMLMVGDKSVDFTDYIDEKLEAECAVTPADSMAHHMLRATLKLENHQVAAAMSLMRQFQDFARMHTADEWGRCAVHFIHLYADLTTSVLAARNGETF